MFCTELTKVKQIAKAVTYKPLLCKRWKCPNCAPYNQKLVRRSAMQGDPTTFITLTASPKWGGSRDERARRLVEAWRMVRQAWERKKNGQKIPFIAVFERTELGEPHLHILCRAPFIPQRWLSGKMRSLMSAPVCDIRRIHNQQQARHYVTKYMSKAAHLFQGVKRWWRSHDYKVREEEVRPPRPDENSWVIKRHCADVITDFQTTGYTIAETVKGKAIRVMWWHGEVRCY